MFSQHFRLHRSVPVAAALILAFGLISPPVSAAAPETPAPEELLLNTTARHAAMEPTPGAVAAVRFRVEVPEAGLLALDLTIPESVQPEPALRLLTGGALRRLAQTPTSLLVEAREARTLLVEVVALEPYQSLPAFKLRSAFKAGSAAVGGLIIANEVDPWDDDLGGKKPPGVVVIGDGLCAPEEQDDHGDVPLCATPIGTSQSVSGVLHNGEGDDEDVFEVRLPGTAVLTVEAVADTSVQLVLRNSDGLAVAELRSEGAGTPLRLARALAAGRYLLEVESLNGDDAVYALNLHRSSRP
jgi:hypothetical protein